MYLLSAIKQPHCNMFIRLQMPCREIAGGEIDVRGCYTAMAAAHMLNLDKAALAEKAGMVQYVKRCQARLDWHTL